MKIYSVYDKEFKPYGKVLGGYDTAELKSITKARSNERILFIDFICKSLLYIYDCLSTIMLAVKFSTPAVTDASGSPLL